MYLELNDSDTEPIGKAVILKETPQEITNLETEQVLQDVPMQRWALSSTDIGKIKAATPIKITIGNTLHLPNICQYLLRPDALAGIQPIIQDYSNGVYNSL